MIGYLKRLTTPVVATFAAVLLDKWNMPDSVITGITIVVILCVITTVWSAVTERWPTLIAWSPAPQLFSKGPAKYEARELLASPYLTNRTLRIVDVAYQGIVDSKTFDDCEIHGPAVMEMGGASTIVVCQFDKPPEVIAWVAGDGKGPFVGPVLCMNCTFRRCRFRGIGMTGNPEKVESLRIAMRESTQPTADTPDSPKSKAHEVRP